MDCRTNSDLFFLTDEKFDFDVSLSPASSKGDEDEDEVFIGPVTHKEKCVSVNETSQVEDGNGCVRMTWSPLIGDQLDAVCQEAHRLATQLQSSRQKSNDSETSSTTSGTTDHKEEFVQDAEAKLDIIDQRASALSPIKRETFCVQDSPMKQLPPAVQRRFLRGNSTNVASSNSSAAIGKAPATRRSMAATTTNPALSTRSSSRLSTSSPVVAAKAQPRTSLRGRASISVGVVLPSKPTAPTTSCSGSKTRVDKTRLQPPTKVVAGRRQSPMSRSSSRAESYEDLLSDSASVASDLSDSSLNSSLVGKRTLAPPTKNVVRNLSGVKAPPLQNRRVADRRNTSSSSSSVSSFNSSLSVSPAKGKLNSSLNRSLSGSTGPAPSSSRPVNQGRTRRSITHTAAEPAPSNPTRRSLSTQARKLTETERAKTGKSTPLKRAQATQLQVTPAKRVLEKTTPIPLTALVRPQSALKAKPKPEAQVVPTPSGGVKGASHVNSVSNMLKPKRLMSANSMDSLPQKSTAVPLTPSAGGVRSLQMKPRRPSALPTPVRHRMSTIVTPTSTNQNRCPRPPPTSDDNPATGSVSKEISCSATPAHMHEDEEPVDVPNIQPFSLEEEQPPASPPRSVPGPNQSEDTDSEAPSQGQSESTENLIELETAEESKAQEVLLLDLPAPVLQPQEKLLIDLTNTPELIRTSSKSCTATQLIDLSSPLIKWSPERKRENDAPLINISF